MPPGGSLPEVRGDQCNRRCQLLQEQYGTPGGEDWLFLSDGLDFSERFLDALDGHFAIPAKCRTTEAKSEPEFVCCIHEFKYQNKLLIRKYFLGVCGHPQDRRAPLIFVTRMADMRPCCIMQIFRAI
jgi:hypothetical protein